jgi:hypothetical protein
MIAPELASLDPSLRNRLRIFTGSAKAPLPSILGEFVMPYDGRLNGIAGRAGTVSDFAQRALRHFAEVVLAGKGDASASDHRQAVLASLDGLEAPVQCRGRAATDSEITNLLRANWGQGGASSGHLLRHLRSSLGIACEQKRFARLLAAVRQEVAA